MFVSYDYLWFEAKKKRNCRDDLRNKDIEFCLPCSHQSHETQRDCSASQASVIDSNALEDGVCIVLHVVVQEQVQTEWRVDRLRIG